MTPEQIEDCRSALGVEEMTPLTQGGQKLVFLTSLASEPVIVKIVPTPTGPGAELILERAHREVDLLQQVESEYVVNVLSDAVEVGEPVFAVTWVEELLDGQDMTGLLQDTWSDSDVLALLHDIAHALRACHAVPVVHRDLSPGNIRRRDDGRFVLMDPGIARHLERTQITGAFQPGTPGFRSPEHVLGGNPIPASDVFALGILAFVARTGQFPIDPGGDPAGYDLRLTSTQSAPLRSIAMDADPVLAEVIDRSLQRQPARRFLDGDELVNALRERGLAR